MRVSAGAVYHSHHLLSHLSWSLDVAEFMVVIASVTWEDMAYLELVMVPVVVNRVILIRGSCNVSVAGGITTSLKSTAEVWSP